MDMRGHGDTKTLTDENLSSETQADDVIAVVKHVFGADPPPIVLVGHRLACIKSIVIVYITMYISIYLLL